MSQPETIAKGIVLHCGDCLAVLPTLEANSVDACVTDPPYHLSEVPHASRRNGFGGARDDECRMARRGFMGKSWDGGDIAARVETWAAVYRVLKPGGHLLAFGGTRTSHRMVCAIEDAGFEIRDTIQFDHESEMEYRAFENSLNDEQRGQFAKLFRERGGGVLSWNFGSGFPKSLNVSKAISERCMCSVGPPAAGERSDESGTVAMQPQPQKRGAWDHCRWCGKPIIPDGLGTALKPAMELICLARKPLFESTVAANVLKWETGALNIDACRVAGESTVRSTGNGRRDRTDGYGMQGGIIGGSPAGRWPANIILDGSDEVVGAFPQSNSAGNYREPDGDCVGRGGSGSTVFAGKDGANKDGRRRTAAYSGETGSAARFFYTAKADADDRLGSKHPTVKPLDLMQYLVRLVTPKGGLVLDPFAGTGTTGEAAWRESMRAVLIEREADYQADIRRRMSLMLAGRDERSRATMKARGQPADHGPLFATVPRP